MKNFKFYVGFSVFFVVWLALIILRNVIPVTLGDIRKVLGFITFALAYLSLFTIGMSITINTLIEAHARGRTNKIFDKREDDIKRSLIRIAEGIDLDSKYHNLRCVTKDSYEGNLLNDRFIAVLEFDSPEELISEIIFERLENLVEAEFPNVDYFTGQATRETRTLFNTESVIYMVTAVLTKGVTPPSWYKDGDLVVVDAN